MPAPKYWRVRLKGGRKAHLAAFAIGESCGMTALCGHVLPRELHIQVGTIPEPRGDECKACRIESGQLARPKRTPLGAEQERAKIVRAVFKGLMDDYGLTTTQIIDLINSRPR
jgi:hypothetical protein